MGGFSGLVQGCDLHPQNEKGSLNRFARIDENHLLASVRLGHHSGGLLKRSDAWGRFGGANWTYALVLTFLQMAYIRTAMTSFGVRSAECALLM